MNEQKGILVLGGSGFVGSQLLPHLPAPVYVVTRHNIEEVPAGVEVYNGGLDDLKLLSEILPKCRWLIHLASATTPGASAENPLLEAECNIVPNLRLIQLLQDYPNVNVLYVSSGGAVYGNVEQPALDERTPLHPLSYYAAGKASIEAFLMALVEQSPRTCIILRPSNIYGPGQQYRPGFGIVPTILEYQERKKTLDVWGDGENVRDYVYIDDFVKLCEMILLSNKHAEGVKIYNVGSNKGTSLNDLCRLLERITGEPVVRAYHPSRAIDVRHIVLDNAKIREDFGWEPSILLEDGLKKTWCYWKRMK